MRTTVIFALIPAFPFWRICERVNSDFQLDEHWQQRPRGASFGIRVLEDELRVRYSQCKRSGRHSHCRFLL